MTSISPHYDIDENSEDDARIQIAEMTGFSIRLVGEIEHERGNVGFDRVLCYAINLGMDFAAFVR